MAKKILVVDDKQQLRRLLKSYLEGEGYDVITAADGQQALFAARQDNPDLILLDLMMPEMGGFDFMRIYTREAETPIIVLTAKLEENDKVVGLELGADDYVTKPFGLRELAARVRAVLRRTAKQAPAPDVLSVGEIKLNRQTRSVEVNGNVIDLTPSEFEILSVLMSSPGRVYSRMELLEHLQGSAFEGYERTIDVHIRNLRTKIEPDDSDPVYIQTVYGIGYRLSVKQP